MLVLQRRRGEKVRVTTPLGDVWIDVLQVGSGQVRLGFTAPIGCRVDREEVVKKQQGDTGHLPDERMGSDESEGES